MDVTRPATYDLSDYLGMMRRNWWLALLATVLGLAVAGGVTFAQDKLYQSSVSVLVKPTGVQDTNVVGGRTKGDINLDTEAQLVNSTTVAADAGKLLYSTEQPRQLARRVSVEVPPNTSILVISYADFSPQAAQAGAHDFAEAYLANRNASAKAELNNQYDSLEHKINEINADLSAAVTSHKADQDSRKQNLTNQLNTLTGRLNQLSTATINGGKIISDAELPTQATKPSIPINLGSGTITGLVLGISIALCRERFDRKIRLGIDLPRRTGVPLLTELGDIDKTYDPQTDCGRAFARLRNEISIVLRGRPAEDSDGKCRVIVVTSVSPGTAATLVATNLASAFTHAGHNVSLITQHAADTAGHVQLEAVRQDLERQRAEAEYVIIEAPSTATSADAQGLASFADAAVMVVELRRSTHAEVLDAVIQLRRVNTPLLSGVAVTRLRSTATPASQATTEVGHSNQRTERQPQLT
jgi:capsular polysaccharide biosynthesis protein